MYICHGYNIDWIIYTYYYRIVPVTLCKFQISDIKRIKPRLQSILFKMTYSEVVDGIKPVGTLSQRLSCRQRCVCAHVTCIFWNLFICLSVLLWFSIFYPHSILQWECISSSKNCQSKWISGYCIFEYISFPFLNYKFKLWQLLYMYV